MMQSSKTSSTVTHMVSMWGHHHSHGSINKTLLPGKLKVWCFQFGILSRLLWPLTVYKIDHYQGRKVKAGDKHTAETVAWSSTVPMLHWTVRKWHIGITKCIAKYSESWHQHWNRGERPQTTSHRHQQETSTSYSSHQQVNRKSPKQHQRMQASCILLETGNWKWALAKSLCFPKK